MQRQNFPSILLYGFGLALVLSLVFNGFLLYEQSHQRSIYEYESDSSAHPADYESWDQQLSECKRVNQQQDSLIRHLEQAHNPSPGGTIAVQRIQSK